MDITEARLPYEALKIIKEISEAHFVALDLEFTGIAQRTPGRVEKPTLQQFYEETKQAAEKYQVLQIGLTIVTEDIETGCYVARPYNFNLSPLTKLSERVFERVWSCHSGAISFLNKNNFKFDLPITQGVQYLSRTEEQRARTAMIAAEDANRRLHDVDVRSQDIALIDHVHTAVNHWQTEFKDDQTAYLNIPGPVDGVPQNLSNYQKRLVHQTVQKEYPMLRTAALGHFIRVTKQNEAQEAAQKKMKNQDRERTIARVVGFRWIIEALMGGDLSDLPDVFVSNGLSNIPHDIEPRDFVVQLQEKLRLKRRVLVGHNCFTDLVYLYQCFIGDLPSTVEEFRDKLSLLLPAIVDTKYLASPETEKWVDTSLDAIASNAQALYWPEVELPAEYDRYMGAKPHEAGYDSLLTARIAIKLSASMERDISHPGGSRSVASKIASAEMEDDSEEEGYVSAVDELDHLDQSSPLPIELPTPLSAIRTAHEETLTTPTGEANPAVVAVKERVRSADVSDEEVSKIRAGMAKTNLYETLDMDQSGPEGGADDDVMPIGSPPRVIRIDQLIKRGELMPSWGAPSGFWERFGNILQVNGSQEGFCQLGPRN